MNSFWLTFNERPSGCVEAASASEAMAIAKQETGFDATKAECLPYPASPRINKYEHPQFGVCPSFCFKPTECKGRTSCPQNYSCTE